MSLRRPSTPALPAPAGTALRARRATATPVADPILAVTVIIKRSEVRAP